MKKLKKLLTILLVITSLSAGAGWLWQSTSPKEVVTNYLNAKFNGNYIEAYKYISSEDQNTWDLFTYKLEMNKSKEHKYVEVFSNHELFSFEVLEVELNNDNAIATIESTHPKPDYLFRYILLGGDFSNVFTKPENKIPKTKSKILIDLIKESSGWRVYLDLKSKEETRKKFDIADLLEKEAHKFESTKDYQLAIDKYQESMDVFGGDHPWASTIKSRIADNRLKIQGLQTQEEKESYIKKVELKDFKKSKGESWGKEVDAIFGIIINNGNRSLKEVTVTVYFLDKNGVTISEKDYHPVLVHNLLGGGKLLKPNYIKDFGYSIEDDVPSSWDGEVIGEVTNIEFSDEVKK